MAKSASMYIRIDPQVKTEVEAIYSQYGMSITDAINVFLYQSRNVGGLPFDLHPDQTKLKGIAPKNMKGALKRYADPDLVKKEKGAWEKAVAENYDRV